MRGNAWCLLLAVGLMAAPAWAQDGDGGVGLRLGVGTDISLGVAGGLEINYGRPMGTSRLELGLALFAARTSEDSQEFCCSYHEVTKVFVGAALANYLFAYDRPGPYFVFGAGAGAISVDWTEESPDDTSLGPPLPGGGSSQSEDGVVGGTIVNFGIGQRLNRQLDLRVQAPIFLLVSDAPGGTSVVPTLTVSLGIGF